jgi:hypothetical protein
MTALRRLESMVALRVVALWRCVTFMSQIPQGMTFLLTKVGTLRSLRALGSLRGASTLTPIAHYGTVTVYR